MSNRENDNLQSLGKKTEYRQDYAPEVLEAFENKHPENDYWVFQLPGVHISLSYYRTARLCRDKDTVCARCEDGGEQESETLSLLFP